MHPVLLLSVICFIFVTTTGGMSTVYTTRTKQQSNCSSWVPYTDAKCLRVADVTTFRTKQEAEAVCALFAETEALDDVPRLVTVKSEIEQKALKQFLFEETGLLEHVWLGIDRGNDGILRWNNRSELYFNNLADQNITGTDRQCVQMESGQGIHPMGSWVQVNCRKRNVAVCEKIQVWTTAKLQKTFLTFKSKVERQIEKLEIKQEIQTQEVTQTPQKTPGTTIPPTKESSPCRDWKQYKNEKCFKIVTLAGYQTQEDAENTCQAFSEGLNQPSRLLTVKTKEEQEFLLDFLFTESQVVDKVWLGLQKNGNSGRFQWNDGTNLLYTNWASQSINEDRHHCVQMASGEIVAAGFWVRVSCMKGGIVVCERQQTWTLEILQNMFLNFKLEQNQIFSEEIASLQQRSNTAWEKEVNNLKRNPVPLGFIYIQLPSQEPPTNLWPGLKWTDVSSSYAGLFFRVVGGQAAPFGQVQEANTTRLQQIEHKSSVKHTNPIMIPSDGSWSQYIFSGSFTDSSSHTHLSQRFRLSGEEVRPRNQAIKVWQRSQ